MNIALIELIELVRDLLVYHYEKKSLELSLKLVEYEATEEMRRELSENPYDVDKYLESLNEDDISTAVRWIHNNGNAEDVLDCMADEEICDYLERRNLDYYDLRAVLRNNYDVEDFIELEWRW